MSLFPLDLELVRQLHVDRTRRLQQATQLRNAGARARRGRKARNG